MASRSGSECAVRSTGPADAEAELRHEREGTLMRTGPLGLQMIQELSANRPQGGAGKVK
jgi:hypothetical protein